MSLVLIIQIPVDVEGAGILLDFVIGPGILGCPRFEYLLLAICALLVIENDVLISATVLQLWHAYNLNLHIEILL